MDNFSTDKSGRVQFFGLTTAHPDFLLNYGISYSHTGAGQDIVVETTNEDKFQLYLLEHFSRQLRVVPVAKLSRRYAALDGKPISVAGPGFDEFAENDSHDNLGKLVYHAHFEDVSNRAALVPAAYDAAKSLGVTHITAKWFGYYLVPDAFFGFAQAQQFTEQGIFIGAEGFQSAYSTVKKQLNLLQQVGALRFESVPRGAGFYFKFNRQCLPGIKQELLPRFFEALLF